jgi:hypothetical protein
MRAHLLKALTDVAGNLLAGSIVAVYVNGTGNTGSPVLISAPLYSSQSGSTLLGNPFTSSDGNLSFYLDAPQRVDLGVTPPGAAPYVIMDVDVLSVLAQAGLSLLAATPPTGFAKLNSTPNIISYTFVADGQPHRVALFASENCTGTETGGSVQLQYTDPGGNVVNTGVFTAGSAVGTSIGTAKLTPVQPGSTVTLRQNTALTAGATTVWAELWGS